MLAVDTNVVLRLLAMDDDRQYKLAQAIIEDGGWLSHVVLAESIWVLDRVYECDAKWLMQAIEMLLQHEHLVLEDEDVVKDALQEFKRKPKLGFSDCLVLAIARAAAHTPLATFDKALAKLADTELVR